MPSASASGGSQAVLRLYRREIVTLERALDLLLGTFCSARSPPTTCPSPAKEAGIWAFTS